jgi:hypothetical protein
MTAIRRFRIPALLCSIAFLLAVILANPFVAMGVIDDGPYILIVKHLAQTGHIVYNGWPTAIIGWQLYLGAAFVKLFGYSWTTVRMSTGLVAMSTAFLLQRVMVRAGVSERNASLGTLTLVLSPLFLTLSVTFMTDIPGLFAVLVCLYGCLRALQSSCTRATILWLAFAVACNAICGSSRQIAWLGILVMVPSALWLLRGRRPVLLSGAAITLVGAVFIFGCMLWFAHQPYSVPEPLLVKLGPILQPARLLAHFYLDIPFLLLPVIALFFPEILKNRLPVIAAVCVLLIADVFLALHQSRVRDFFILEPALGDIVEVHGIYNFTALQGSAPLFLNTTAQVVLTIVSLGGLTGLISAVLHKRTRRLVDQPVKQAPTPQLPWHHLCILLLPYVLTYTLLVGPRAASSTLLDRYTLGPLLALLILLVRYYQDHIRTALPAVGFALVGIMAVYAVASLHNLAALYRARTALAAELRAAGVPDTAVDNGWEYNFNVELGYAPAINDPRIIRPKGFYHEVPPRPPSPCKTVFYNLTPHIHPRYAISFDPNACQGPTQYAPIHYSRWFASPGTLYVVADPAPTPP